MDQRQQQLLNLVVEDHIKTAEPVGSKFLIGKNKLDWSEATVRNDLRALEEEEYLTHPHTSAGRVPTEKGYRFYLDNLNLAEETKLSKRENDVLGMSLRQPGLTSQEQKCKSLTKALSELSDEAVLLAFSPDSVYYTGLSNLFSKPEFKELELVADLSQIFDHCEQCLADFFDKADEEPKYFIGHEHSFGNLLSVLAFRFDAKGLFALLGPMRMNYRRNWALMGRVRGLL